MFFPGIDRAKVLQLAALAAKWREPAKDALDTMVLGMHVGAGCGVERPVGLLHPINLVWIEPRQRKSGEHGARCLRGACVRVCRG